MVRFCGPKALRDQTAILRQGAVPDHDANNAALYDACAKKVPSRPLTRAHTHDVHWSHLHLHPPPSFLPGREVAIYRVWPRAVMGN